MTDKSKPSTLAVSLCEKMNTFGGKEKTTAEAVALSLLLCDSV
jgi:hypothetical protein